MASFRPDAHFFGASMAQRGCGVDKGREFDPRTQHFVWWLNSEGSGLEPTGLEPTGDASQKEHKHGVMRESNSDSNLLASQHEFTPKQELLYKKSRQ